jgi:hypothetical protein
MSITTTRRVDAITEAELAENLMFYGDALAYLLLHYSCSKRGMTAPTTCLYAVADAGR